MIAWALPRGFEFDSGDGNYGLGIDGLDENEAIRDTEFNFNLWKGSPHHGPFSPPPK